VSFVYPVARLSFVLLELHYEMRWREDPS
jgi:hypothetical protein